MDINEIVTYMMLSAVISLLISIPIIHLLYKYKIVRLIDKDFATIIDKRRLKMGTPIMGGLIVVIAVLVINLVFNFNGTTKIPLLVFLISALLGAFDDVLNIYGRERPVRSIQRTLRLARVHSNVWMRIFYIITLPWAAFKWIFYLLGSNPGKGIQAHEKIIVQLLVGGLVAWWIYTKSGWVNPSEIWIPWMGNVDLGIFIIPLIILVVIGTANAVNFSDGMDGLAAGLTIFAFFGYLVIAYLNGDTPISILCSSIIGSLIVYLYFNIPPARFQMGDVGSLALGTLLATVAFALNKVALLPVIGFIFVAEILSTVIQGIARRLLGRRLLKMAPIHLHFEMVGWPEYKVVMRAWIIAGACVLLGVWLSQF